MYFTNGLNGERFSDPLNTEILRLSRPAILAARAVLHFYGTPLTFATHGRER